MTDFQRAIWPILLLTLITAACEKITTPEESNEVPFRLSNYDSADAAKVALDRELPKNTSREAVIQFLESAKIVCFDSNAEVLACRYIQPSSNPVHVVWQLAFYFDSQHRLDHAVITRGYAGP
jgi:hypothetical protein